MKISEAFAGVSLLGVETSPFIYFVEKNATYVERMRAIFGLVDVGIMELVTSAITLTEVLVMPIQTRNTTYQVEYRAMLLDTARITTIQSHHPLQSRQRSFGQPIVCVHPMRCISQRLSLLGVMRF